MDISLIFAMNADRIIGNQGNLPWHLPSDLQRFKEITSGQPVIMGRKTFESILARNGRPLPKRHNVVITRDAAAWHHRKCADRVFDGCVFVSSFDEALDRMEAMRKVFVIGGAEIYAQALPLADHLYFTQVGGKFEGDTFFPLFNMHDWETTHDELVLTDEHPYAFSILNRTTKIKSLAASLFNDAELVNPAYAKSEGYGNVIAEIVNAGVCPFCPDTFLWHPWPILHRRGNWAITRSGWPYENAEHHFMIIGDRHFISDIELGIQDEMCIRHLTRWAVQTFGLTGWGRGSRSGDTNHTGATVQHLHYHLIQPKIGPDGKALPVLFPIG